MAVPKPEGAVRLCVDFRAVNQLTLPDRYPLPRIDDLIGKVSAARYLTTLDLSKGYHQIALTDETKPKTAFICHKGKYQYTRLPFGLCNAPSYFQKHMDLILADLEACAYIDDLVIAHSDWNKHISTLKQVLQRCREKNVSLKKVPFYFSKVKLPRTPDRLWPDLATAF